MQEKTAETSGRIASLDQFRGYTVAGMCLVNFVGGFAAIHPVLKHNNNYFSYADSIMPSFLMVCGFSYRLSALRRLERDGNRAYLKFILRSLGLVLVSLLLYEMDTEFKHWSAMTHEHVHQALIKLVKANLWEVLAIIGVCQLLIMPVIAARASVRAGVALACLVVHLGITYAFNWNFVYGGENWLDHLLGTTKSTAWDGGVFGLMQWSAIMLVGSLAYDVVTAAPGGRSAPRLAGWGILLMLIGYGLSCLSMLHDGETPVPPGQSAASPVVPPLGKLSGRTLSSLVAEPPLVQPPPPDRRPLNYWMMNKKIVSLPFVLFSTGWALGLYALFAVLCDGVGLNIGVFRTFGTNPLAAYLLSHTIEHELGKLVPNDAPLWYVLTGLGVFAVVTYLFVRYLESQRVFIRL